MNRRQFVSVLAAAPALPAMQAAVETPEAAFTRRDLALKARPFPMTRVRLSEGPYKQAQEANRRVLDRLPVDRLVHTFRLNAGLPSSAEPLGGWEKPDCELRGHFPGHFLSACALMYSSTGDAALKDKGGALVAELAKCQAALKGGYLSAFPLEFWDRLKARQKVWAPFYTIHKIMAGLFDMYEHCGNRQALEVLEGMAGWAGNWTGALTEDHMQDVLNTEFGGMNDVLYNLAGATGNPRYAQVAHRFDHKRIFNPLALRRDELKGLHVNTQVPKIIGASRRYELTGERRCHDVADYFWYEVTSARAYATGGTSNDEHWLTEPLRLAEELSKGTDTAECCVAYNMMKLTRHLYQWTADPRYFDYYERTLFNHRLGTIHAETGRTMYYLSLSPGAWKTYNTDYDSFWCCTGTGVEEYSKLNDSIYFHDDDGLFVNLFIASELDWKEKGVRVVQETRFPEQEGTRLTIKTTKPVKMALRVRVPSWSTGGGARLNGKALDTFAAPGSYFTVTQVWKDGDRLDVDLPMSLRVEPMPDDETLAAMMYGPLVLAGEFGSEGLTDKLTFGPMGPDLKEHPMKTPSIRPDSIKRDSGALAFRSGSQSLAPLYKVLGQRYATYWRIG